MQINWYGLTIALGVLLAGWWVRRAVKVFGGSEQTFEEGAIWVGIGGVVGARLWHVATDWSLYADEWSRIPAVWQGGVSILGALVGGGLALVIWQMIRYPKTWREDMVWWADIAVLGLPIGQAIGRWGNFVNQEVYGWPTWLPWGIPIELANRPAAFISSTHFHPLFLYEAIPLLLLAVVLWKLSHRWKVGSGRLLWTYVVTYAWLRFGLEFIRLDKAVVPGMMLGLNQAVVAVVGVVALVVGLTKGWYRWAMSLMVLAVIWIGICLWLATVGSNQVVQTTAVSLNQGCRSEEVFTKSATICATAAEYAEPSQDRSRVWIQVDDDWLHVELVNTPSSITQGLSDRPAVPGDGMLFFMPKAERYAFWMIRMQFDLDMIWIRDGQIVDITRNAPAPSPGTPASQLPTYRPNEPAELVLEVPAGTAAAKAWQPGDPFKWYH